jgi:hypothetical protein
MATAAPLEKIQIINTNAGRIVTAHARQYDNVVYITGLAYRPSAPTSGAHVHTWGVDKHNRRVFFKTSNVYFTGKPSLIFTSSFIVTVDPLIFKKAGKVYITFHRFADEQSLHSRQK